MKKLVIMLMAVSMIGLSGCGGGGGNSSVGGIYYSHTDLAYDFVDAVNRYMAGYDLEIQKINTQQYDYIVVYDYVTDSYDAYYLGAYNPGENISNYLYNYDSYFYFDLDYIGGNLYEDYWSGTIFEKAEVTQKDTLLMAALEEELMTKKVAETMQAEFGLSEKRSRKWAEAFQAVSTAPQGSLSDVQIDNISAELIGSTVSELKSLTDNADFAGLAERVEKAGALNDGMSTEQINKVIAKVFAGQ